MFTKQFVSAVAALGMATSVVAVGCDDPTATIQSVADATAIANCETIKGSVLIDTVTDNTLDLTGLTEIGGNLTALNNGGLISLSSSTLTKIGGTFQLHNVTLMSTLQFTALSSVGSIDWQSLNALQQLTFGDPGVTSADSVFISDTFLSSLDGINVESLRQMRIDNNKRLTTFTTKLSNLSDTLVINANGLNLDVSMPNLLWIANMTISNVTSFSAQSLAAVNGSIRFDSNYLTSFSAPNLTEIQTGDLAFVSNSKITNISMPLLKSVGGGFTIANNTALEEIDSFPNLELVGGAILLRGDFSSVVLPALDDVRGAFNLASTGDLNSSCTAFGKKAPASDGGNGNIQGDYTCTSNDANANNSTSSDGGSSSGNESAASVMSMGSSAAVGLAALGALVTLFF